MQELVTAHVPTLGDVNEIISDVIKGKLEVVDNLRRAEI